MVGRWLTQLAQSKQRAGMAIIVLCLATYLPGLLRLPPVDRTEIVFAETTREMLARGTLADPRYGEAVHQFRPIGTYWAQAAAATIAGPSYARTIAVYRIPGMVAVLISALGLYMLTVPLVGSAAAFIAAGLFAVAPLTVLLAHLAIAEGVALLPATLAMLSLLRIYTVQDDEEGQRLVLLLWVAVGVGMLVNALQTPILIAATLIALWSMDRDLKWLRRTNPGRGLLLALVIASPWLMVRAHQDGIPFANMSWRDVLEALGGSQDMKLRAWPGTFLLAAILGFLPGTALLVPAGIAVWRRRDEKIHRFLVAWILGYFIYLEALSSKPGTYSVQVLFPAFALAVALLVTRGVTLPKFHAIPWPPLAALFAFVLFGLVYGFAGALPGGVAGVGIVLVALLFYFSAAAGRDAQLVSWAAYGIIALAAFAVTLLAIVLPGVGKLWTARSIAAAVSQSCGNADFGVLGFREPSSIFTLGAAHRPLTPEDLAGTEKAVAVVESRWLQRYFVAYAVRHPGQLPGPALGCVASYNVMRGCPLSFTIFAPETTNTCQPAPEFRCDTVEKTQPRPSSTACD